MRLIRIRGKHTRLCMIHNGRNSRIRRTCIRSLLKHQTRNAPEVGRFWIFPLEWLLSGSLIIWKDMISLEPEHWMNGSFSRWVSGWTKHITRDGRSRIRRMSYGPKRRSGRIMRRMSWHIFGETVLRCVIIRGCEFFAGMRTRGMTDWGMPWDGPAFRRTSFKGGQEKIKPNFIFMTKHMICGNRMRG